MRRLAAAGCVAASLAAGGARETATTVRQEGVFSTRAELVVLQVRVEDRRGTPVLGLPMDAFVVLDEGRPQQVQFFGAQDDPVTIGLLVDNSGSMREMRRHVVAAAAAFVDTSGTDDDVFALMFNERVRPVLPPSAPFTSAGAVLQSALARMPIPVGQTALYDAIRAGLDQLERGRHQRRVLVVVADGEDNASVTTAEEVIARAQSSHALIYAVTLRDPAVREGNSKRLRRLAEASGGEAFEPGRIDEIDEVLRHIALDIRSVYTLGYDAPADARPGTFHRVRVETRERRRDLRVRTREGYRLAP